MDDAEALVTFDPIESWRKGDDVHISYTVARDTRTSTWDWIGLYKVLTLRLHQSLYNNEGFKLGHIDKLW